LAHPAALGPALTVLPTVVPVASTMLATHLSATAMNFFHPVSEALAHDIEPRALH
jgi:hypothetical protein